MKKDIIKVTSILILLLGLLTILYLSEIQSISGYGFAFPITFFFYFLHDLPPYLRTTKKPVQTRIFYKSSLNGHAIRSLAGLTLKYRFQLIDVCKIQIG